jgi:hypothetical protein
VAVLYRLTTLLLYLVVLCCVVRMVGFRQTHLRIHSPHASIGAWHVLPLTWRPAPLPHTRPITVGHPPPLNSPLSPSLSPPPQVQNHQTSSTGSQLASFLRLRSDAFFTPKSSSGPACVERPTSASAPPLLEGRRFFPGVEEERRGGHHHAHSLSSSGERLCEGELGTLGAPPLSPSPTRRKRGSGKDL